MENGKFGTQVLPVISKPPFFLAVGVAVDRAAVAAVHLDGVLLGLGTLVLGGLHAAVADGVDLARLRLAGLDRLALGVGPVQAFTSGPTGALVVVLGPFLLGGRHDVVVVGADDLAQHVVGQVGHGLRVLDVHAAVTLDDQGLELLGAHDGAQACAGGVVAGVHHDGVGQQVLAGRADGGHAGAVALEAVQGLGGGTGAHAPDEGGVLDLDLIVLDVQVHRLVGLALDDDGIVTGKLDLRADHAAAVRVDDQMVLAERGQEADGGTASQRHAGSGQRADGVNDLGLLGKRIGASRHLIVHDLVGKAHAADVFLIRCGGLGGDAARRQIDAQDLAGPAV